MITQLNKHTFTEHTSFIFGFVLDILIIIGPCRDRNRDFHTNCDQPFLFLPIRYTYIQAVPSSIHGGTEGTQSVLVRLCWCRYGKGCVHNNSHFAHLWKTKKAAFYFREERNLALPGAYKQG
jgi:hypothetical protein